MRIIGDNMDNLLQFMIGSIIFITAVSFIIGFAYFVNRDFSKPDRMFGMILTTIVWLISIILILAIYCVWA